MIEVIEQGKKLIAECNTCGAKLSYQIEDVISYPVRANEYKKRIKCACCGEYIYLD